MIVKCEQCQTRFKIPDDKVTDKGVKVRCTKCSHTFRVTRDMAQPAGAATPGAADPFARFGAPSTPPDSELTKPGVFALGVEASKTSEVKRAPAYPTSAPAPPAYPGSAPPAPPGGFDFSSLTPPGQTSPTVPAVPAFTPPSAAPVVASPFDFAAIARPTSSPPPPASASAFDFSNFAAPTQPMAPLPPARQSAPVATATAATSPALPAFDFSQASPPAPTGGGAFDMGGLSAQSSAPMDLGGGPAFSGAGSSADGFFAGADDAGPGPASPVDGAAARAMFDMPAPAPDLLDVPAPEPETASARNIERVSVARVHGSPQQQPAAQQAPLPEEPARRRTAVGIVVNVAIAAVLVLGLVVVGSAYLNEGKFSTDALSLEGLKNTFAPSVAFVANDVSNGLYETRAGRSVFFVRGEVMNRSEASVKVVVKAEIVEDGKVVRAGESWAGEPASPEEIFLIDNTESLEGLNRKVEKRALVVPPGAAAAFVVPFTEYPPDLKGFRVRVSARAVAVSPTAANP